MSKMLQRLAQVCVCVAAPHILGATSATAEGNPSLFSPQIDPYGGIVQPMEMPRPKPLLFVGADPAVVETKPEQRYPARLRGVYTQQDLSCLAEAIYFEARGESRQGQLAVAEVILNRVDNRRFPSSVCGVINQPQQFSYTIGGTKSIRNKGAYREAVKNAEAALSSPSRNLTGGATYFHTRAVRPDWSSRFTRTAQIGHHIFYRTGQRVASN